jgi:hypothetical protein
MDMVSGNYCNWLGILSLGWHVNDNTTQMFRAVLGWTTMWYGDCCNKCSLYATAMQCLRSRESSLYNSMFKKLGIKPTTFVISLCNQYTVARNLSYTWSIRHNTFQHIYNFTAFTSSRIRSELTLQTINVAQSLTDYQQHSNDCPLPTQCTPHRCTKIVLP